MEAVTPLTSVGAAMAGTAKRGKQQGSRKQLHDLSPVYGRYTALVGAF
jgi:hypothetical protein